MKDLTDLAQIVTKTKLRSVELIGDSGEGTSKLQEFYDLVSEGRFSDDDEAAEYFYGEGKSKSHPSYQKLRKTLKDRLVNSLFIIDLKQASYTGRQKAYYEAYKEWAAAKILFGKNARVPAVGLGRKLLKIARKYEFTELIVDICHTLRLYHGTIEGDYKKYQQYNEEFRKYEQIWIAENRAEEFFIDLSIGFINSKATKAQFKGKALEYFAQVKDNLEQFDSYQLHLCGRLIEVSIHTSVNEYEETLDVCNRAIAFFKEKNYVASVPLQVFLYQKFICHVQLRQFEEAKAAAQACLPYLEEGSFNWFKLYELYFLLYTHSGQYEQAEKILNSIMGHSNFEGLPENIQETWKISEAYLYFLECTGHLAAQGEEEQEGRKFRLAKFLNEMEVFSKDKQGMNIAILIIEILLGIAQEKYDELIDRTEAMEKYRSRYLREEGIERANHFLRMLLQLPKNAFRREDTLAKTEEDRRALAAMPIEMANQTYEIEIIPYEKLWDIVMEILPE